MIDLNLHILKNRIKHYMKNDNFHKRLWKDRDTIKAQEQEKEEILNDQYKKML